MIIKKAIYLAFLAIFIHAGLHAQQKINDKFKLTIDVGNIKPLPRIVILTYFYADGSKVTGKSDSVLVEKGKAYFEGEVPEPAVGTIQTKYFGESGIFCLSPNKLSIKTGTAITALQVKGSPYQKDFEVLFSQRQYEDVLKDYIIKNAKKSALSVYALRTYSQMKIHGTDSLYKILAEPFKQLPSAVLVRRELDTKVNIAIGTKAPQFSIPDTSGKVIQLKSYLGKYVLIDFWASWCHPCREESPYLIKAYGKFKHKNFDILGISLDSKGGKNAWLKAIRDDQVGIWKQVSDLNGFDGEAAKFYSIKSIPQNYLIDPQGKIVAMDLRGEALEKKLNELL